MLAALQQAALHRAQGRDHEHVVGLGPLECSVALGALEPTTGPGSSGLAGAAQQIAAIRRTERPGVFELGEAEEWAQPRFLIAYLLGLIGTAGSGIWPSRWISWIHCCGLRIWETCDESALLVPNIGV